MSLGRCLLMLVVFGCVSEIKPSLLYAESQAVRLSGDVGMVFAPLMGVGSSVSFASGEHYALEFGIFHAQERANQRELSIDYYSFNLKQFWVHNLFTNLGFGFRSVQDRTDSSLSDEFTARRRNESFGLNSTFGQQWRRGQFVLAIDWFGYFLPILTNQRTGVATSPHAMTAPSGAGRPLLEEFRNEHLRDDRRWNYFARGGQIQLLKMSFGMTF